jgi:hypothetical protein
VQGNVVAHFGLSLPLAIVLDEGVLTTVTLDGIEAGEIPKRRKDTERLNLRT